MLCFLFLSSTTATTTKSPGNTPASFLPNSGRPLARTLSLSRKVGELASDFGIVLVGSAAGRLLRLLLAVLLFMVGLLSLSLTPEHYETSRKVVLRTWRSLFRWRVVSPSLFSVM